MAKWQGRSLKKASSGRRWLSRKKRKYELGREPTNTRVGPKKKGKVPSRGSEEKSKLLSVNTVNVTNPGTGKSSICEVKSVLENPADPHLARRNIITKGAIIETDIGKVRVTSRPGQEGSLDAVLLEEFEEEVEEDIDESGGETSEPEENSEDESEE